MAKRFTDTDIWKHGWFSGLTMVQKNLWFLICDQCDSIGIWPINLKLASFYIGSEVTHADLDALGFGKRLIRLGDDKIWVTGFIRFQYKNLSTKNPAHRGIMRSIISALDGIPLEGVTLELIEGFKRVLRGSPEGQQTLQDKEKDKDKDKEKEKEEEKEEGGCGGNLASADPKRELSPENLRRAREAWHASLAYFKAGRNVLLPLEEDWLARAIQRHGIRVVEMACLGFREQKRSDRFDPGEWVDISRVFRPDNFMRFVNAGVAAWNKTEAAS